MTQTLEYSKHLGTKPSTEGGPGHEEVYWLRRKLQVAVAHLRDIEDYYRPQPGVFAQVRADRVRAIYEQITADLLEGKITVPTILERARAQSTSS